MTKNTDNNNEENKYSRKLLNINNKTISGYLESPRREGFEETLKDLVKELKKNPTEKRKIKAKCSAAMSAEVRNIKQTLAIKYLEIFFKDNGVSDTTRALAQNTSRALLGIVPSTKVLGEVFGNNGQDPIYHYTIKEINDNLILYSNKGKKRGGRVYHTDLFNDANNQSQVFKECLDKGRDQASKSLRAILDKYVVI